MTIFSTSVTFLFDYVIHRVILGLLLQLLYRLLVDNMLLWNYVMLNKLLLLLLVLLRWRSHLVRRILLELVMVVTVYDVNIDWRR